ncbi:transglutaminase-like domain-containing protein [Bifidobacterium sp. ESL0732]|uniref:transglutaminase-like domain-containing protein n=1 Tax=Bifidobacterium sp. ESL0732 TaxID=2983222 RepID=UPI0023F939CB|nr:transglutaminase-like domain-containing protein [Bifidobacterium sp. ESL0732]WEV64378.1 transglutaminase-like domain-containing protein [Bifidobacterium sp. ESL0732]
MSGTNPMGNSNTFNAANPNANQGNGSSSVSASLPDFTGTTGTTNTTGTWASTTRAPIALTATSDGQRQIFVTVRRPWATAAIGALLVLVAVCLNSANLIDVYGNVLVWATAAIPAALLGALIALAGVNPALKLWWQIVFLVLAQFLVGPIIALNDTTIAHIVPSLQTLSQGFTQTFGSFKYVIAVIPPLGNANGGLMALWTLNLWTAFLAGIFAVSASNKINLITVFPLAMNLAVSALLGTSRGTLRPACGIIAMLALVAWLAWRWQSLDIRRPISMIIIIILAVGLAFGATLIVPQHRLTLRDRYNPPLDPHQYTSPLSDMRSYVKYHKKETLLSVSGLPAGTPVRLAVMDRFDGNVWNLSDSTDASDSSDYRKIGSGIANTTQGEHFKATFKVHKGFSEQWLPLAGDPTSVGINTKDFYYNMGTNSAIVPDTALAGQTYSESGVIAELPTQQQVAHARAQHVTQPEAKDIPDGASKLAPALTGKQSTDGATAQTLATALKTKGWFSHGLAGDYPSLPGHGNFRIDSMLGGSAMVGDSEQYASAMAMMARELNLPSRVVLGFIPKDKDGNISKSRTTHAKNGVPQTDFTGNDIEAWVEINFKDYGWVPFYPTPKETKVPNKNQDLTPPNPKTLVRQPPVPLVDPLHDQNQARDQSSLDGADAGNLNGNATLMRILAIAKKVAVYGSPVWIILIICGLILLIKAIQLALMARRGSSGQRIASGWKAIDMLADQSGIKTSGTRRQQVAQIDKALKVANDAATVTATDTSPATASSAVATSAMVFGTGQAVSPKARKAAEKAAKKATKAQKRKSFKGHPIDMDQLKLLSREADWVAFSGEKPDETASRDYWKRVKAMRKAILADQPRMRRLRTRLSLKGVFHIPHLNLKRLKEALAKRMSAAKKKPHKISKANAANTANSTKDASILTGVHSRRSTARKGR